MSTSDTLPPSGPSPSGELEVFASIVRKVVREEQSGLRDAVSRIGESVAILRANQRDLEGRMQGLERTRGMAPLFLAVFSMGATGVNTALVLWLLAGGS